MSTYRSLLSGSTGLNTVVDPVRIEYDWREGISDLAVAVNVTITQGNRINRRKGKTLRLSASGAHSLFCDGGECVFVRDSSLYLLGSDSVSSRLLRSLTSNAKMSYAQVGNKIYFTNNADLGYVEEGIACTWSKTTDYVGPVTRKSITGPFAGNHLAFRNGRMYISTDNVLWYSMYLAINWYRLASSFFQFNSHIRMVKPVKDGLYVSTEKRVYFLHGDTPKSFVRDEVVPYPALEWSDAIGHEDGSSFPDLGFSGSCALWVTKEGAMVGSPSGIVKNLNRNKVIYPEGTKGVSLVRGLNFIHTVE